MQLYGLLIQIDAVLRYVFLVIHRNPDGVTLIAAQAAHLVADLSQVKGHMCPAIVP